jgi:predicted Rossmann fold flavoprotein
MNIVCIGGGAAGVFAAINAKNSFPHTHVLLLEKSAVMLAKVKISGGGRCNVTHACFDPRALVQNYPRGHKELLGPFYRFQPRDTIAWFEERGVTLKTEEDGRMFPVSDSSSTIIECLLNEANRLGVEIRLRQRITSIEKKEDSFEIHIQDNSSIKVDKILLATGSSPDGYKWAESLGHTIQTPVPSLFTFNIPSSPLLSLSGITLDNVELSIPQTTLSQTGPLLLTHFGFSGPAVLKLSAWGARYFHEKQYRVELRVNWLPRLSMEKVMHTLDQYKKRWPHKPFLSENPFFLPKNLWKSFLDRAGNIGEKRLNDISSREIQQLASMLHQDIFLIEGKTTHKEEFVTCGGITLKEIDFKTMESKVCPGLYFAGEILDIDGVTGGFNFQNAWTTGFIAGSSIIQ